MDQIDLSKVQWDAPASSPKIDPQQVKWDAPKDRSLLENLASGVASGFADVGDTVLNAAGSLARRVLSPDDLKQFPGAIQGGEARNAERSAGLKAFNDDHQDSAAFKGGRVAGNVAATLPVGGVLGAGVKSVSAAPVAQALGDAIASGGFKGGQVAADAPFVAKAINLLTRMTGGAINGGASSALVDPSHAATGAAVGAALPPALIGAGKAAGYVGRAAGSIVKPFTPSGQEQIADNIIRKFAQGGPTTVNAAEIVQGSKPTLAEATGNAGLATLQRGVRDIRPNAFVEREGLNDTARTALFDEVAGDAGKLAFFRADRAQTAEGLYGKALDPANQQQMTPFLKGQITQLLKRPSITEARKVAQQWAIERGEKPSLDGSLQALHDVKTALDDKIAKAVQENQGGQVKALEATKNKLLMVMEKLSPDYAAARSTYAEMSKPVNAMETLQGLRLTDAQGNITLAKVQNALRNLQAQIDAPGANSAKSVTAEQMQALTAIRDDLLRKSNQSLGKSIGSNTFQNIATDNIISNVGGGMLSSLAHKTGAAGVLGQVGKLAYSGPNEAIRNKLVDKMLNPASAQQALSPQQLQAMSVIQKLFDQAGNSAAIQAIPRAAPVLLSDR